MNRDPLPLDLRMHELVRRSRDARMSVTPQRAAIYRALLESEDHPSPEILYRRVHRRMPSLSLATIYKALDALVGLGLVRQVDVAGETKRYDANLDRHHHMICTRCRKVTDSMTRAWTPSRPRSASRGSWLGPSASRSSACAPSAPGSIGTDLEPEGTVSFG